MTAPLWSLAEVAAATGARVVGAPAPNVIGISIDSRTIRAGEAFFAIRGEVHDGHDFVAAALERGAALAVVAEEKLPDLGPDGRYLVVPDVLAALERLGAAARSRTTARIAAVTGSVGKTSTKEALRTALSPQGATHAATASFNNHWGVPLTLARMPAETAFGVFEIGMNHAGEIRPLTRLVRPHVAVVTTVAAVHLAHFNSVAEIADAKAEIFEGVEPGGAAVIHRDIPEFERLYQAARRAGVERIVSFGEREGAEARLDSLSAEPDNSLIFATIFGEKLVFRLGAPGKHHAVNALAVLAATELLGADMSAAADALSRFRPAKGRGARHALRLPQGAAVLIDESYNANPTSMRAAIALLAAAPVGARGRRIAVLGDMLELGDDAPAFHAELAEPLEEARVDRVYCAGPLMRHLHEALPPHRRGFYAAMSEDLAPRLLADIAAGDAIMVKGSLGSRMGPLVELLLGRYGGDRAES